MTSEVKITELQYSEQDVNKILTYLLTYLLTTNKTETRIIKMNHY